MNGIDGKTLLKSFGYAIKGVKHLLRTEQNARIHLTAAVLAFFLSVAFHITRVEAMIIFIAVTMVFALEIINTAIEKILDFLHPDSHSVIGEVKDALAGAVLIAAFIAAVVAVLIFYPYVKELFETLMY